MIANTVLLICREAALVEQVRDGLGPHAGADLDVVGDFEAACGEVERTDPGLIAVHLGGGVGARQVAHLLWLSSMKPRPVPVLAVGDAYHEREATDLLRMGVADYVGRAEHADSLGPVIAALTQEARAPLAPSGASSWRRAPRFRIMPSSVS